VSRYEPLRLFLVNQPADRGEVRLTFGELEQIVGPLPSSARELRPWWANRTQGQSVSWQSAGWVVDTVNLTAERVVFIRGEAQRRSLSAAPGRRPQSVEPRGSRTISTAGVEEDHTEAAVQARLVAWLIREGWDIRGVADTASRSPGIDVLAERNGQTLAVEVKGFPSRHYADPRRADEAKPTNPATQARQWYSHALLKALLTRDEHSTYEIAIALPDQPTYRSLYRRTKSSLDLLRIGVLFVTLTGEVSTTQ
jgi:hypothetical protein